MVDVPVKPFLIEEGTHRIDRISYAEDRVECTCGTVTTAARGFGWADHRRRVGLRVVTVGQSIGKRRR